MTNETSEKHEIASSLCLAELLAMTEYIFMSLRGCPQTARPHRGNAQFFFQIRNCQKRPKIGEQVAAFYVYPIVLLFSP